MFDIDDVENFSSSSDDEVGTYDSYQFDPEQTSGDPEFEAEGDALAMRDAMRDIVHDEGRFELLMF
ncbi:MAG TPA: hypothetical protein VIA18_29480 [Polyangia bacterium]|jgi:hypothetical protein|nr:hypothetical protein [Polyangia bacterium]